MEDNIFRRPETNLITEVFYPYPKTIFKTKDFFEIILPDCGAYFFFKDYFHAEMKAEDMLKRIEDNSFFGPWEFDGNFFWDMPLQVFDTAVMPWERAVWINRLYFLPAVAQGFFCRGDIKYARLWMKFFKHFIDNNPYPNEKASKAIVFRDMQTTWRLLNVIHSVYLLSDNKEFSAEEWREIYSFIETYAEHVYSEARRTLEYDNGAFGGNHFQQKGLALLYAGILFPEFANAEKYIETGKHVLKNHLSYDIMADGGCVEASPSYGHFIARMHLEACLLLQLNNKTPIQGQAESVVRQYEFLYKTASPDGKCLQISDSYAFDTCRDYKEAAKIFPLNKDVLNSQRQSCCFKETGFSLLTNEHFDIYTDCIRQRTFHQHFGRPQIVVYKKGNPLLVDAGCVNYDLRVKEEYFHRMPAHNVVTALELEKAFPTRAEMHEVLEKYSNISITYYNSEKSEGTVKTLFTLKTDTFDIKWQRTVILHGNSILIEDTMSSANPLTWRQYFHLPYCKVQLLDNNRKAVLSEGANANICHSLGCNGFELIYASMADTGNNIVPSCVLTTTVYGKECVLKVRID